MKVLIVAATKHELEGLFNHYGLPNENFIHQSDFDVLITGVGITATAFALGHYLRNTYNLILNVGIAGSFDKNIALGSLVNIVSDTFSELGAENGEDFITIDELGFGKSEFISTFNPQNSLIQELPKVKSITVNTVHGNIQRISTTLEKYNVQTESMEGAAVFYAAEQMNIPVLQVRSISNYIEHRNKENWKIGLAISNLNKWLITYLNLN